MTRLFFALLLALVCLLSLAPGAIAQDDDDEAPDHLAFVTNALDAYVLPAHAHLADEAAKLDSEMGRFCQGRARPQIERVSDAFKETVRAFAGVSFFRFGPWAEENRFERFVFWPDRKGLGLRQVRATLKEKKEDLLQVEAFKDRSVALQGLLALEYLIYVRAMDMGGKGGDGAFACAYGQAITNNLKTISAEVLTGWQGEKGYARLMLTAGKDNPLYHTEAEAAREVMKSLILALQVLRDQMLSPIVGKSAKEARGKRAFLRRSGLTYDFIATQLTDLKRFVAVLGLASYVDDGLPWIKKSLVTEFELGVTLLQDIKHPIEKAVGDAKDRKKLSHLIFTVNKLHQLIAKSIIPAMGIELGFNALDGD